MNRKAQVTLWVIIAVVMIVAVILFFFIQRKVAIESEMQKFNPKSFIDLCARKAVDEATDKMILTGGFIEPKNYKIYKDIKVPYLCENRNFYLPCINQHPMLLQEYKEEIMNYSKSKIEFCFESLKKEIESRQGHLSYTPLDYSIDFGPNRIYLNMNRKATIINSDDRIVIDDFSLEILNPLYDIALVAMDIAAGEAKNCNFEYVEYMILYKRWDIKKHVMSDSTKIYIIKDANSGKEMYIATRGCAIPAGR